MMISKRKKNERMKVHIMSYWIGLLFQIASTKFKQNVIYIHKHEYQKVEK